MYYIYHIPNRKEWGCTTNLEKRLERLNYTYSDLDRVITVPNIDTASEMEAELNIEYGYGWNTSQDYRRVIKMGLKGAKKGGDKNVESGHIFKAQQRSVEVRTGTKHSQETKEKIRLKRIGQVNKPTIAVLVYDKENNLVNKFNSISAAASVLNLQSGNISSVVSGKLKTTGGYKFIKA